MLKLATMFTGGQSAIEFALKYENIEYKHILGAEWDKFARKQVQHFHGKPKYFFQDVSKFDGNIVKDEIDLLVWGSSCKNFSLIGDRKGIQGNESRFFIDGLKRQKEMMPKCFIFENVKGMLSSNNGADFKMALEEFTKMGYLITHKVLNAKDFGTPQNRERLFIVGFLDQNSHYNFTFETPKKLDITMWDLLDEVVDDKYIISDTMLKGFVNGKSVFSTKFKPKSKTDKIANCLDTKEGGRRTNNFIPYKNSFRKLTPKEMFTLMGVKGEDISICVSDTQARKIAGNGIDVNTLRSVVRSIYKNKSNNLFI